MIREVGHFQGQAAPAGMTGRVGGQDVPALLGVSDGMKRAVALIDRVAGSDCSVLIEGETGTGKELAARRLHAKSPRRDKPFIPVNCAGISETLFDSQFFGHVRGAFTGAEQSTLGLVRSAEGGTLFLDEVSEIPLNLQAKLLRTLQDGEVMPVGTASPISVETRFIAATNRSLADDVRQGRFRSDLYYRLNVIHICLPPLREREEDVGVLLDHFLGEHANRGGADVRISPKVRHKLAAYPWPGNVRELMSWVDRLHVTGLPPEFLVASLVAEAERLGPRRSRALPTLQDAEKSAIAGALEACDNNRTAAADVLGIHRGTLLRKITQHGLA